MDGLNLSKSLFNALSQQDDVKNLLNIPISKRELSQPRSQFGGWQPRRGQRQNLRSSFSAGARFDRILDQTRNFSDTNQCKQNVPQKQICDTSREECSASGSGLVNSKLNFGSNTSISSERSTSSTRLRKLAKDNRYYRNQSETRGKCGSEQKGRRENFFRDQRCDESGCEPTSSNSSDQWGWRQTNHRGVRESSVSVFGSNRSLKSNFSTSSTPFKNVPLHRTCDYSKTRNDRDGCGNQESRDNASKGCDIEFDDTAHNTNQNYSGRGRKNDRDRGPPIFGYKYLEGLSHKEVDEIILEITKVRSPFDTYLQKDKMNPDWLFLMLNIIRTVCLSDFKGNRSDVLDKLCKSKFLTIVSSYLSDMVVEENPKTKQNLPTFVSDLSEFYSSVLNTLPLLALETDMKRMIMRTRIAVDNLKSYLGVEVDDSVKQKLQILDEKYDEYMKLVEERLPKEKVRTFLDRIADCSPPEDFRELSLYPTYEDIARKRLGFVRPNKVSGAYDSVEHYLDVQFRLLREDFIDPLRNGLRKYLESKPEFNRKSKFRYDNVRLYPGTLFEHVQNSKTHQVGILLNFDPKDNMKRIKWERSKRFMHGSLLLFTTDDFQTFFHGTVLERDLNLLKSGRILMTLTDGAKVNKNFFNTPFLMAESEVFFEPYFLVMKLLRELRDETFPMKKYIVEGKSQTDFPAYLPSFLQMKIGKMICDPLNPHEWPSAFQLGLDSFQYTAYKAALTRDFCVIQGPPGTGKTFLGLKIVQTIWCNAKYNNELTSMPLDWKGNASSNSTDVLKLPILVVCYTNHALDQFLEGMLKFTQRIVRVGGQSRSEIMQKYNLRGRSNLAYLRRHISSETMFKVRADIKSCREEIDRINQEKKSASLPLGILKVCVLAKVVHSSYHGVLKSDEVMKNWLLEGANETYLPEFEIDGFIGERQLLEVEGSTEAAAKEAAEEHAELDEDDKMHQDIVNEDDIFVTKDGGGGDDDDTVELSSTRYYSVTVDELGVMCQKKINEHQNLEKNEWHYLSDGGDYSSYYHKKNSLQMEIIRLIQLYKTLKTRLKAPNYDSRRVKPLLTQPPKFLSRDSRWIVYWHWVSQLRDRFSKRLEELEAYHRNKMAQYEEYKQLEDLHVVKAADVVGMTTTGAARLNLLLKQLCPAVVVVEEAAEVLEAHIIASLTNRCQHVILIGDHEQLKPSAAVYELSRNYNIDVSLFERMIKNGMDCPMLNVQHRMRPEISCLITPLIYPNLSNHESVYKFESIKGVKKNVFFIEHHEYEQVIDDTQSKQNLHEAEFMVSLARYLVQNGYNPEYITILTTYMGQMFLLRELKKDNLLVNHVKCVVVDKYQGEENEIILLSLVRSNEENKIGFLSIKNRVCVALSRAKKGLYITGNMDCLTKTSELWQNIKKTLEENNAIGKALELYCQKHDQSTMVATVKDFDQVKEGGCNQYCNELMACGHLCSSLCHIINENHEMIKCREPCRNTCPRNHPCKLFCYEKCQKCFVPVEQTLPCQHVKQLPCHVDELTYLCVEMIDDVSPLCKHNVKRKCHQKAEDAACTVPCEDRLDCGHACTQHCHKRDDPDHIQFKCPKPCERLNKKCSEDHVCQKLCFEPCGKCSVKVTFQLPCGHEISLPCSTDISKIKCYKKCVKNCPQCKKRCKKLCHEDCHPCMFMVKKTIPECGHEAQVPCSMPPTREYCQQKCELIAPCGHQCKSMCRKACGVDRCMEIVKSYDAKPLCGHSALYFVCHQRNAVPYTNAKEYLKFCQEPCDAILECGDPCRGTCGECWQGRLHKTCQKNCGSTLICGHICNFPCRQLCPPCNQQCNFKCKHSHCPKSCGVPCVTCMETCDWRCEHSKCTKKCGEMCNRKPCTEPCKLKLTCGHDCIGFCGEPCPQYCRICNPEITEIVLGYEDEPDARFVLLVDCNHTIESRALDQHLSTAPEGGEIVMKVCPLCKTPITKTLRYMNYVKQTYQHIINVKKKIFGDNLKNKKKDLAQKLQLLVDMDLKFFAGARELRNFLLACHNKLGYSFKNKHQISQRDLAALTYYHQVLLDVTSRKGEFQPTNEAAADLFAFLNRLVVWLHRCNWCVNRQQMIDFGDELRRYHKMVDFCKLLENELYAPHKNYNNVAAVVASVRQTLFGLRRFTAHVEDEVQRLFGDLQKELRSSKPLTSSEKHMINEAMRKDFYGGGSGHWFTCSKGHYYCITECGGATQKANCPECGEIIGGTNHRYVPTARLASDMDGASKPAWSSGHDMRNFAFED